jgi:hypothetical protein
MSAPVAPDGIGEMPRSRLARYAHVLRARLRRRELVEALARGADPWASPELMHCAVELTAMPARRTLAQGIDGLLRLAEHGAYAYPYVRLRRSAVLAERETLAELAHALLDPAPLEVRGVALLARLLGDPSGPLFDTGHGDDHIHDAVLECRAYLASGSPP